MSAWLLLAIVFATGMLIPLQPVINAGVARQVGHPLSAALVSVTITLICIAIATFAVRAPHWGPKLIATVPLWAFFGGLIGAFFIVVGLYAAPRLGIATVMALLVAGQLVAALLIDHFGLFGMIERSVTPWRVLGALLLCTAVVLIRRF